VSPSLPIQFSIGYHAGTPGALVLLEKHGVAFSQLITSHIGGDSGAIPSEHGAANNGTQKNCDRILSSYLLNNTEWVDHHRMGPQHYHDTFT
jgi:hypothetical protein